MAQGVVVVYEPHHQNYAQSHERASRAELAKRLAAIKGARFAGDYDPLKHYPGPVYFVPSDTIIGLETANRLGIRSEQDLFGGVVPYAFTTTKVITHPLFQPDSQAPTDWVPGFARRVHDIVLPGFSVFSRVDASRAGARLLERGTVRLKPARASGGQGQIVVSGVAELEAALDEIDLEALSTHGLVLEENLADVTTFSVGWVHVAELVASYYGTQHLTRDNNRATVYGGSELVVVRGDFDTLLGRDLPVEARLAVVQARAYDAAATAHFPGLFASRRNYDIAVGLAARGQRRSGVLEQSWRIGGASCAEIAALHAFQAEPALRVVRASSVEIYGNGDIPPDAIVFFRGIDDQVGPITKYALVKRYDDTR
jgi:hypothetical protein